MGSGQYIAFSLFLFLGGVFASCGIGNDNAASCIDSENYNPACATAIKDHVVLEFKAALQYLLMGAYFEQDTVNLPGSTIFRFFSMYDIYITF